MSYRAYGTSIRKEDYGLIRNMAAMVTTDPIDIYDLKSYEMNIGPDDVVFLFGRAALAKAKDQSCRAKITFPEPEKLNKGSLGEEELRVEAFEKLSQLKEILRSGDLSKEQEQDTKEETQLTITEDHMLDEYHLDKLQIHLKERNTNYWMGTTKAGKVIKLTNKPEKGIEDINLTFAEYCSLMKFMEVFGTKEINIVYKPSSSRESNT